MPAIISAAEVTDSVAIHPGYGFLSENADFAERVEKSGFTFIGPKAETIRLMGDKVSAINVMKKAGVPCVPGSGGPLGADSDENLRVARHIGYPVIIKASGGGGGRGMRVVHAEAALLNAINVTQQEAQAAFGNPQVYMEKFLEKPRHIEFQVIADNYGNVVHLGERDCSMQRRHQKVIEEAPAPGLTRQAAPQDGRARGGSLPRGGLSQRRHAGVPLPGQRVLFHRDEHAHPGGASGHRDDHGHRPRQDAAAGGLGREAAVHPGRHPVPRPRHRVPHQCRGCAHLHALAGPGDSAGMRRADPGIRVDSHVYSGYAVPPNYDSMVAKLIAHGDTRETAIARMRNALAELVVEGIKTNTALHQEILSHTAFRDGGLDIHYLERRLGLK